MIIDKINAYLSNNNLTINDSLRYEVEKLAGVSFRRQFMQTEETVSKGKLRLSSAGNCARKLSYAYHGFEKKGKEIDSRSKIIFFQGDLVELMLISIARLSGCNLIATGLSQALAQLPVNGQMIDGHPDGILIDGGELLLVEVKSMSSYGFEDFQRGEIDDGYFAQVNAYMSALGLKRCVFVGLNKDSGVLHEMIVNRDDALVEKIKANLLSVIKSTPESLPVPAYDVNDKGFYPWQCLYCAYWGLCRVNAEKVLVGKSYKLKEKK